MLLNARLGSDGFSMFVNGASISSGAEFAVVNVVVSVVLIALGWARGRRPGPGTVIQPVIVGVTVSALMPVLPQPDALAARWTELLVGFVVLCFGVAGYLAAELGAGPAEVAALAFDPPVPFRWGYSVVQVTMGAAGWLLGADLGPGTVLVVLLIGPVAGRLLPVLAPRPLVAAQPGT